jgi:hypothetical protein
MVMMPKRQSPIAATEGVARERRDVNWPGDAQSTAPTTTGA